MMKLPHLLSANYLINVLKRLKSDVSYRVYADNDYVVEALQNLAPLKKFSGSVVHSTTDQPSIDADVVMHIRDITHIAKQANFYTHVNDMCTPMGRQCTLLVLTTSHTNLACLKNNLFMCYSAVRCFCETKQAHVHTVSPIPRVTSTGLFTVRDCAMFFTIVPWASSAQAIVALLPSLEWDPDMLARFQTLCRTHPDGLLEFQPFLMRLQAAAQRKRLLSVPIVKREQPCDSKTG